MKKYDDVLLHCFHPTPFYKGMPDVQTLCGQNYGDVMFAHWPAKFNQEVVQDCEEIKLCPKCAAHPDLPLLMLGDVGE